MNQRIFSALLACIFALSQLSASPADLQVQDVHQIMSQILDRQGQNNKMTSKILRNSFKVYIDQFDPYRTYLLESEVSPYLNMSEGEVAQVMRQYQSNDFAKYMELNQLIQSAIERTRRYRTTISPDQLIGLRISKMQKEGGPFPKTEAQLQERIRLHMATFLDGEKRRFGPAYVQQHKDRLVNLYRQQAREFEDQYLPVDAGNTKLANAQDEDQFLIHVLKALSRSLDAHTSYMDDSEAYDMRVRLNKGFIGVGLIIQERANGFFVTGFTPNGPAGNSSKILVGDQILEVNGKSVEGTNLQQVRDSLQGEKGTSVRMKLLHPDRTSPYLVNLTRDTIVINEGRAEVTHENFGNGIIGVIKLDSFYRGPDGISSEADVKKAIEDLDRKGNLRGLVLDLRENTGGFLSQAVKVAGLFITNGVIVISKYNSGEERYYRDMDASVAFDGPLIVLTSKATASAAEIVAQALQDYGVAIVVGDEHTYGKGTIQSQTVTRDDRRGSYFKVTVGKYYTVSGKTPQLEGVKSDIVVPGRFSQMELGEEYLDIPEKSDNSAIMPAFSDALRDINPSLKSWYLRYYMPTLQSPRTHWGQVLPKLQENSRYRMENNSDYSLFLKQLKGEPLASDDEDEVDDYGRRKHVNYGRKDLQREEAVNILKDMIYLQPRAEQDATAERMGE